MNKVVKVDGITSPADALLVNSHGKTIISLDFTRESEADFAWSSLGLIAAEVAPKKRCGRFDIKSGGVRILDMIGEFELSYADFSCFGLPDNNLLKRLATMSIQIIISDLEASYDDDPSWIFGRYQTIQHCVSYFQLDLFPRIPNSWEQLSADRALLIDEMRPEDINELAGQYPVLVTLDFSKENIVSILRRISNAKGIAVPLGNQMPRDRYRDISVASLLDIISLM